MALRLSINIRKLLIIVSLTLAGCILVMVRNSMPPKIDKTIPPAPNIIERPADLPQHNPPQYVLLSFDGSRDLQMWQATREFASNMTKMGKPINFTYFISGVYFLPATKAKLYQPPRLTSGTSKIGFADTTEEIPLRIDQINQAISEGHEIASHLNGHFTGGSLWNKENWLSEINQFTSLLAHAGENSGHPEKTFPGLTKITGIRAPNLSKNNSYFEAISDAKLLYDSTLVGKIDDFPYKIGGVWEIPLKNIPLAGTKSSTVSMDYNIWVRQSQAKEVAKKGNPLYAKFKQQTVQSYLDYFNHNYQSNRSPVVIGHHFSLWNDGVYWDAMKMFIEQVCGLPDVRCTTFSKYVDYLNETSL